jgi:hypothetical protein
MNVNMNDIDNILQDLNVGTPSENSENSSQDSTPTEETNTSLSDEELDEIIEDNGLSEEEIYDENQEEGNDIDVEESEGDDSEEPVTTENNIPDDAKIPLNSPTLLIDESTTRFSGAEWFNEIQKARIIVAGIGGIGSNVVFQLARMIPANLTLYDDDNVERVNMAGQLFSSSNIGESKVTAIANMIYDYTSMKQVLAIKDKFTSDKEPGDIMICGFDNMRARRTFFNSWYNHISDKSEEERSKCLYLDGRLSIDTLQILCIRGDDQYNIERYEKEFLFADYEADATICSMKQTTYLACMIGSLMVNLFTNFIANSLNPIIPYDLPFFTEYDAQNMLFKTES